MNVHDITFPNGEIRGQLQCPPAPTPTPTATSTANATPTVTVTPTATPTRIPGDINGDGFVDIRDYGVWRQQFGATNCGNAADLNGDCLVDIRDYGIWRLHFGEGNLPGNVLPGAPPAPRSPSGLPGAAPAPVRTPTATPIPR
jgi:Dockerin type I domain